MSQMMMYIVPLLLGRTFDMNRMEVGRDIYSNSQVSNPLVIESPATETTYKLIDGTEGIRDLLDVSGSFDLNVKSGLVKAGASGAYMSDVYNRENVVEIAIKATFQTVTECLHPKAQPMYAWHTMSSLGTHFVKSIVYGGELIASIRLVCNNTRDKLNVKAALEGGGRIKIFDVGAEVEGEYFTDVSKSVDSMQIKVYSSVPLSSIPKDMDGLKTLLGEFGNEVKKYNDGKGVPIKVELWPLSFLDSNRPQLLKNRMLESYLVSFGEKFDDLLNTKAAIKDWMKEVLETLTATQETMIGKLYGEVTRTLNAFFQVIGELDLSNGKEQLAPALSAYGNRMPGYFQRKYLKLRQQLMNDRGEWFLEKGSGATYKHWGKTNCLTLRSETLYSGYALGPWNRVGGSNFLCIEKYSQDDFDILADDPLLTGPISYKLQDSNKAVLNCAVCRLSSFGSAQTFIQLKECPKDWKFIYRGIILNGTGNITNTDSVCLDVDADDDVAQFDTHVLVPSFVTTSDLVSCIVCAK